jgi:phosphatidate phosphatase
VLIGELIYNFKKCDNVKRDLQKCAKVVKFLGYRYLVDLLMMNLFMAAVKFFTGAHRPHFFETCKPDQMFNCTVGTFVPTFTCTNTEASKGDILDASTSFFSGHTSNSIFSCFFVIW